MTNLLQVAYDRRFMLKSREWFSDAELRQLTETPEIDNQEQEKWFDSLPKPNYHIWGILYENEPIGAFGIKNIQEDSGEYWGYIGEKRLWGMGIGKWMIAKILSEAKFLKLSTIYLRVRKDNARAIALYHKQGFVSLYKEDEVFLHMAVEVK